MSATTTAGLATVQNFYGLLGEGRFDDAVALLHDEVVFHESIDLPYGGDYHGKAGFAELGGKLMGLFDASPTGPIDFLSAGDLVIVRIPSRFTSRATGASVEMPVVEISSFRDGLIAEVDVYYKNPAAVAAIAA